MEFLGPRLGTSSTSVDNTTFPKCLYQFTPYEQLCATVISLPTLTIDFLLMGIGTRKWALMLAIIHISLKTEVESLFMFIGCLGLRLT